MMETGRVKNFIFVTNVTELGFPAIHTTRQSHIINASLKCVGLFKTYVQHKRGVSSPVDNKKYV